MQTAILTIKGMTCMGCVSSIRTILEKIPGVSGAEVSFEDAQVTIQFDAARTGVDQLKLAIEDAGFEVIS
jgi:copper chaperone